MLLKIFNPASLGPRPCDPDWVEVRQKPTVRQVSKIQGLNPAGVVALERHFRVRELASLWGLCDNTIIRLFSEEQGVLRLERVSAKRKYVTLSIPESIALRVHERRGNQSLKTELPGGHPLRIVRLRDLDGGVSKKSRNVLKLHSRK